MFKIIFLYLKGVIRGLHFQREPFSQGKLVYVLNGSIFDYVINVNKKSVNFKKSFFFELSSDIFEMIYIPPGYAHGFQALEDNTIVFYKCTQGFLPTQIRV